MKLFLHLLILATPVFGQGDRFHEPIPGQLPYFLKDDFTPIWDKAQHPKEDFIRLGRAFSLQNQKGNIITEQVLKNHMVIAHFFFATCSGYCPIMARKLTKVQEKLKTRKDLLIASFSVTPNTDTVERLQDFAQRYQIDSSNWHLLRGERNTIYDIARNELLADLALDMGKKEDQFVHSESVYLIDHQGFVRGIYNGNVKSSLDKMIEHTRSLPIAGVAAP